MTSTYDAIGSLLYEGRETPEIIDLLLRLSEYAIDEISKVNPKILNWEEWSKKPSNSAEFLGGTLRQLANFFSDAHSFLDHKTEYHLNTVHRRLDFIIGRFNDWFARYKDRDDREKFFGISQFEAATIRRYPKIFKELHRLIETGFINLDWLDKRRRNRIEKWKKYYEADN